ncbi:putative toxin-antitoxin system toxin component, PIN family [Arabiibacter massiliensis]|uniref:putative toxin-antitoxin system toxin component, PIN family n=1 Tax=Arabiibacter massiliensis TaxID=1870985 RepID=UPI00155B32B2|nr:putative toxin-antitoxin system toxin component, PIN family [Arabiibacter massiliensis]
MTYLILDTNILVSALWQNRKHGKPSLLLGLCIERHYGWVYTASIYREYEAVLSRPKFGFDEAEVEAILKIVRTIGLCADPVSRGLSSPSCADADDQKFYDAARSWDAILITGNKKHFPEDERVKTPAEFLANRLIDIPLNN